MPRDRNERPYHRRGGGGQGHGNSGGGRGGAKDDKPVVTEESSEVLKAFLGYQKALDEKHDRYERLVKLSRDVTIESKRAIFVMQRVTGQTERDLKSLNEAKEKFELIHKQKFYPIAVELIGQDPYQYVRAYSPGIQEYIEAVSFHRYLTTGKLLTMQDLLPNLTFSHKTDQDGEPRQISVHLSPVDYLLGIADLTGELMRVGVNSVGQGDFEKPFEICAFLQKIHDSFVGFGNVNREIPRKLSVLKSSLGKVENVCYTIQIRGSEFPKHILAEMIKSSSSGHIHDDLGYCADG